MELKKLLSEDTILASPRDRSPSTVITNGNGASDDSRLDGSASARSALRRERLAHPGKGNIDRLSEFECWKIFEMLDVSGNGQLYPSDVLRALGLMDEDKSYTEEEVTYWMVRAHALSCCHTLSPSLCLCYIHVLAGGGQCTPRRRTAAVCALQEELDDDENGCLDFTEFMSLFEQLSESAILLEDASGFMEVDADELDDVVKDLNQLKEELMDDLSA